MLNNEVKTILQEQFSKEQNYQKIINNINKKQNNNIYSKIIKYALLPTCAIVFTAVIVVNNNNEKNEYKEIAKLNTTQVEIENNTTAEIAEKEIYKTIEGGQEASWAYDLTVPENIINDNIKIKSVIKVKILKVGEGEIIPKQENFYNPFTCHTPIKMQVIDNLLETNELSGTITAYISGGKMKIKDILKGTKQEIEYMGIYDISQLNEEDREKYIEYTWTTPYYEPIVGDEYVIIINKVNENLYKIADDSYGIFKVEKINGEEKYINVVTNEEWKME